MTEYDARHITFGAPTSAPGAADLTWALRSVRRVMAKDSRRRMVMSAATLIGSRGVSSTSFRDVLKHSRTPRGSIYHHFPEGKRELVGDALRWTTEQVLAYQRTCTAKTASGVLEHFVELFRQSVVSSNCRAGCPVAGVVVDTYSEDEVVLELCRASFRQWISLLTSQLAAVGLPRPSARSLAITALASIEGALILSRAEVSVAPLATVADQLSQLATVTASRRPKAPERC
jgi:TetR/AcrR family transcriptional repressor of lmrAB and yxaGH operons